ncbi:flagellar export chaperone FliS [Clostridium bornimense]|uniref:flagellar export chaperone FliS n=1 Tax=Clostridium bornimense TaxID=1216932 RepID=UPI001C115DAC|nr:flagellar export chaperone FliS [Clostridium bornimense]MBU5314803.1 flagellar export chaperone FliS [Clostridium bornimense]
MQNLGGYNAYKNNSVNYASKNQLLLMLVDGAVKFSKLALKGIEENNISLAHENLIKTQNIFNELIVTLDVEAGGEWARNLRNVYGFIVESLVKANMTKSKEEMEKVLALVIDVRNLWHEAYDKSIKEA